MVLCVVIGCSKRSGRDKDVSYYRIPVVIRHQSEREYELSKKRRDGFLAAISRDDLTEKILRNDRICSRHFIAGKPANLFDETNPDWLPTQNLGHTKNTSPVSVARWERMRGRKESAKQEAARTLLSIRASTIIDDTKDIVGTEESTSVGKEDAQEVMLKEGMKTKATQTELTSSTVTSIQEELSKCHSIIQDMTIALVQSVPCFCMESLQKEDTVRFYTGLPNFQILKAVFDHVVQSQLISMSQKLTPFQEFMLVMVKLRLNCASQDLAYRFRISTTTVSRILLKWLTIMDIRLKSLIFWPDRDALQKTMPDCFQASFGKKVAVVIDCFEIFCERPSNLKARASTWSSYKHHNTVKVLIGITPQGMVSFVSETWGGRVSDKYLTEHCGILDKLLPGDIVLADRGFDIADSVGTVHARLHIPAFTKGKNQLTASEVEETRTIANVRIHVERVIGNVRQKFPILQSTLPIHFIVKRVGEDFPLIDRIVRICCALNNVCDSVVPFD